MNTYTRYWFTTQFLGAARTTEPLSVGIVDDSGRTLYACALEADYAEATSWEKQHLITSLDPDGTARWMTAWQLTRALAAFTTAGPHPPEFWAYRGEVDWVLLSCVFGTPPTRPNSWPTHARDLTPVIAPVLADVELPPHPTTHHALDEASWARHAHLLVEARPGQAAGPIEPPAPQTGTNAAPLPNSILPERFSSTSAPMPGRSAVPPAFRSTSAPV